MADIKCNYHTHTCYCDGIDSPEEIILTAIELGFRQIGISGHVHTAFDECYAMSPEATELYRRELQELKAKYADQIDVLIGLEYDYYSEEPTDCWDYLVGSVHYIRVPVGSGAQGEGDSLGEGVATDQVVAADAECVSDCPDDETPASAKTYFGYVYIPVDESAEDTRKAIDKYFGGDAYSYAECYFETVADVVDKTGCDIIGHMDLITKFNEKDPIIDESNPRYVAAYMKALDRLVPAGVPFEINSNAVAKGYRTKPYPSVDILREIAKRGGKVILSSDCHDRRLLDYGFDEMVQLARECGFDRVSTFTEEGEIRV